MRPLLPTAWLLPAASLLSLATLVGCEIHFSVTEEIPEHTIMGSGIPLPTNLDWNLDVTQQSAFQSRTFSRIKEIRVRDLVLEIQDSTPEETFDFLNSIELWISARIDGSFEEQLIAYLPASDPQFQSRRLQLITSNENILPFVEADDGYIVSVTYSGQPPQSDVDVGGHVQYRLTAAP